MTAASALCSLARLMLPEVRFLATAMVLVLGLAGLQQVPGVDVFSQATYRGGEAQVDIQIQRTAEGEWRLVGCFSPDTLQPGHWHFYDKNLTGNMGIATQFDLQPGGWMVAAGEVVSHQPVRQIDFFGDQIPVYPDGPAFFSQALIAAEEHPATSTAARVIISYMLCSDEICQMPQQNVPIELSVSQTVLPYPAIVLPGEQATSDQAQQGQTIANAAMTSAQASPDALNAPSTLTLAVTPAERLPPQIVGAAQLPWYNPTTVADIAAVLAWGKQQDQAVMLDFTGPSCTVCQQYKKTVMPQEAVAEALQPLLRVRLNTDAHGALARWQQETFFTQSRPYYAVVQPDATVHSWSGSITADDPESIAAFAGFLRGESGQEFALPSDWLGFLLLAIAGGLFTLLMPCTYPMIPLTVNFFTKQRESGQALVPLAAAYAAGIIGFFVAIGVIIVAVFDRTVSDVAGSPWTNLAIAVLFVVLGLSLLGVFFLRLPARLGAAFGGGRGGIAGALVMGATFAITAFTCTAPFAGAVLAAGALTGEWLRPVIGMMIYGLVIAVPFFWLSVSPALLAKMPRAGNWMNEFKHVGGIIEIAAALKFIALADVVWGWGWFTRDRVLALWLAAAVLLAFYCWGWLRFPSDTPVQRRGVARWLCGLVFAVLALILFYGLAGGNLGGIVEGFFPLPDTVINETAH